jgi:hypothetical protein
MIKIKLENASSNKYNLLFGLYFTSWYSIEKYNTSGRQFLRLKYDYEWFILISVLAHI